MMRSEELRALAATLQAVHDREELLARLHALEAAEVVVLLEEMRRNGEEIEELLEQWREVLGPEWFITDQDGEIRTIRHYPGVDVRQV